MVNKTLANLEDDQLILAFQKGNRACFEVLFDRYLIRTVRYVATYVKNMEEAKDISQEVFIKAFKALPAYKPSGKFVSWLFTIARRSVIDFQRKKKRDNVFQIKDEELANLPDESSSSVTTEILSSAAAEELLKSLPEAYREILLLRVVEDLSYNEISEITGHTPGNLRKIVHRTIQKLCPDANDSTAAESVTAEL